MNQAQTSSEFSEGHLLRGYGVIFFGKLLPLEEQKKEWITAVLVICVSFSNNIEANEFLEKSSWILCEGSYK